ncbi:MAG: hypothetical protein MZW92_77355 [Comamonadaceae bacterium]|nr:hypothetical protein [Comamonadaceae bacterium]
MLQRRARPAGVLRHPAPARAGVAPTARSTNAASRCAAVEAPLTPEQRAQREAESRRKKEQERLAKEERMRNQALLDAYSSEKDIEAVRDRTLREIEKSLQLANESYAEAAKRQKELSDEMQFYQQQAGAEGTARRHERQRIGTPCPRQRHRIEAEGDRRRARQVRRRAAPLHRADAPRRVASAR